jgi:lysozyme
MRKMSAKGIELVKRMESEVLFVYADPVGILTVGVGHVVLPADKLKLHDRISPEQSTAFLQKDLAVAERAVEGLVKVPLNQNQFDALVSFVFNVGVRNFADSTLLKLLNLGDYKGTADQFKHWVFAKGKKLGGLIRRRNEEARTFLS